MIKKLAGVVLFATFYTILRYVVFGHVSLIHLPAYLLNKSVAMASVICLFLAALCYWKNQLEKAKLWGISSFHFAFIHGLLSVAILSVAYYPKLFIADKMNLTGELTVLFGVLAAYCYWFVGKGKFVFVRLRTLQWLACLFILGHPAAMGFKGWLTVGKWYGGLPPISLLGFLFVLISFMLFLRTRETSI